MMFPGKINREFSAIDFFVQQQMVKEKINTYNFQVSNHLMIIDLKITEPYFSQAYHLQVLYHSQHLHAVLIKNPNVKPSIAIHMYNDKTLCLYYPPDISPYRPIWVYKDLIPLAKLWIHNYERWLQNGNEWKGEEAPNHWFMMQQLAYAQNRDTSRLISLSENTQAAE